jgi:hypothetical protein
MKTTNHRRSLALVGAALVSSGCAGGMTAVPPVEFRLNSPAPPSASTVHDNHHEINQNVVNHNNVQVTTFNSFGAPVAPSVPPAESRMQLLEIQFTQMLFRDAASREVPGMQAVGEPFGGTVREGQFITQTLRLEPRRCYKAVAAGFGVGDLSIMVGTAHAVINLVSEPRPPSMSVARTCVRHDGTEGIPALIAVRAGNGSGTAYAQVYVQ